MGKSARYNPASGMLSKLSLLSIFLAPLCESLFAQQFRPFHANSVAVYTTAPVSGRTSSLAFTTTDFLEGDSIFYPIKTFDAEDWNGMLEVDWENCDEGFWSTGDMCHPADVPLWLGGEMRKIAEATYEYTTVDNEILTFDYGISEGDSALIYQNADMQLYLIAEGEGTGSFLGMEDSFYQFYLAHLNAEGEPLDTDLHEAPITLGNALGAIHFMRIDSFPHIFKRVKLAGHSGAEAGLYEVKMSDVYDFQVGDVFQHLYQNNLDNPFVTENYYETRTVVDRVESEFQILYTYDVHRFTPDSALNENFAEEQTVFKTAVIASFPFEVQYLSGPGSSYIPNGYIFKNLTLTMDSCGSSFTYSTQESFYHSCPVDSIACFGHTLHVSPEEYYYTPEKRIYKQGYGITFSEQGMSSVGSWLEEIGETKELIYSSKNGINCGNQIVLSTEKLDAVNKVLRVYPNPATSSVRLDLPGVVFTEASLCDMQGRLVLGVALHHNKSELDVSNFPKGVYMLKAKSSNGQSYVSKLVVH